MKKQCVWFALFALLTQLPSVSLPHEGMAGSVFEIVTSRRYERGSDGKDSKVRMLSTLEEFKASVSESSVPVVVKFYSNSSRVAGGDFEMYQDLARRLSGKVLFVSIDGGRASAVIERFMSLFFALGMKAQAEKTEASAKLVARLALLHKQLQGLRQGEELSQAAYLFFKDEQLIVPGQETYQERGELLRDISHQLLRKNHVKVLKVPSPWQQGIQPSWCLSFAPMLRADSAAIARRLHLAGEFIQTKKRGHAYAR